MYLRTFVLAQLIGWGIGLSGSLWAQVDTVAITSAVYPLDLNPYCEALVDSQERWTIQTAEQGRFQPLDSLSLPLPLSHRLWTRIHVYNQTDSPQVVFLMVGNTDSTVVYWQDGAGRQEAHVGTYTEASNRNLPFAWRSGAKVRFEPKVLTTVYLLVKEVDGRGPAPRPSWRPYGEQSFELLAGNQFFTILLCFFLGGLIFTFIYNLVIAISVRSWAYLYYSLYLLCVAATFYLVGTKEMFPAFGPGVKWQNQWIQALFLSMAALCYLLFGRRFLDTSSLTPRWDYALRGLIGVRGFIVAAMLVSIFISPQAARLVEVWSITWYLPESGLLLVYLVRLTRIGTRVVWFFIVGSVLVFLGSFMPVWLTMVFGILTSNATFILASLSLEVIVFSLGLGYKLRQQQREKLAAEQVLNQELQKVNTAFGRFVPHAFLESLGHESILDVQLGDQVEKEVTVLFSDIRRYTT
ncbi:MAG: 7TM-DISM domain-containing protein, partial [Bacteroidota bacterium]